MNKKINNLSLADLKTGDVFKIIDFDKSCGNFKYRLQDLGIHKGQMGQILNKTLFGPVEFEIDGRKIAIGRGMSKKIFVKKFNCPIL